MAMPTSRAKFRWIHARPSWVSDLCQVVHVDALMQLVEQHKLDLDRNVNDYLDFKIPRRIGRPITVRNLMTHTAGFEEMLKQYATAGAVPRSLGEYLKAIPVPKRIYPPGTVPAYSNYGAELAGYIVQRVSGEPFSSYIENHILNPLGMRRSTFRRPPAAALPNGIAKNYGLASSGEPLHRTRMTQNDRFAGGRLLEHGR